MNAKSILRWCSTAFLIVGALLLGGYGFIVVQGKIDQARDRAQLASLMEKAPLAAPKSRPIAVTVPNPVLKTGDLLGEIQIPRVGIDTVVLEGDNTGVLRRGAGHIPGTALPNSSGGNVGIAAHRDTYFRPLRFIRPGDTILLKTPKGSYQYRVQSTRVVEPSDVGVLAHTDQPTLTLVTCYPFYYVGPAPHRFIVRAKEVSPN